MPTHDIVTRTTEDSKDTVKVQALPPTHDAQGYSLDGYDWIEELRGDWTVLPSWGKDGYDAGGWPYIILAVSRTTDEAGPIWGLGTYCEGDLTTKHFRDRTEFFKAITVECLFHWRNEQSHGPKDLPESYDDLADEFKVPHEYDLPWGPM